MNKRAKRSVGQLTALQQFLDRHTRVLGAVNETRARGELDEIVLLIAQNNAQSQKAKARLHRAATIYRRLGKRLRMEYVAPVRTIAALRLPPAAVARCANLERARSIGPKLTWTAKLLARAVEPDRQVFVDEGLDGNFLPRMLALVDDVDAGHAERCRLRMSQRCAAYEVTRLLSRSRSVARILHVLVSARLAFKPELLASWRRVSK